MVRTLLDGTLFSTILLFKDEVYLFVIFLKNLCHYKMLNQFNECGLGCDGGAEWDAKGCEQFKNGAEKIFCALRAPQKFAQWKINPEYATALIHNMLINDNFSRGTT